MIQIISAIVHDEDTGKILEPTIKMNKEVSTEMELEEIRRNLKRQKDNGHKVEIYFIKKMIH